MQKGIATLQELEIYYSLTDILERCDALDAVDRAEKQAEEAAQQPKEEDQ